MDEPSPLSVDDAPLIAAFTRVACPYDLLSTSSVERGIFHETDPLIVLGSYDGGLQAVGAAVVRGRTGWIKFLAVHPRARREGIGRDLVTRLEAHCAALGATGMGVGGSAPFYVVPGIDARITEAVVMFEALGYTKSHDAVNLSVTLRGLAMPRLTCTTAKAREYARIAPWVAEHFPHWIPELERAVELGTAIVHEDLGFACYDVNREGWFGPTATRPDQKGTGVGSATLLATMHQMRLRGYERADIAWAAALPFYLKAAGARISRVFWGYNKTLAP